MVDNKKIIFCPEFVAFGGGERGILAISRLLYERKLPHEIVCYFDQIGLERYADWPLEVVQLRPRRHALLKAVSLNRYLRATGGERPLLIGIQAACHIGMCPVSDYFMWVPDTPSLLTPPRPATTPLLRLMQVLRGVLLHHAVRRGMRNASAVSAMTQYTFREMDELYGIKPVIIHIGGKEIQCKQLPRAVRLGERFRLLSVCRLETSKRIDWILEAIARLEATTPHLSQKVDWVIDIVGDGPQMASLKEMAVNLRLDDRVTFHGYISDDALESIYRKSHLFLMPAKQGFGLPAVEALERGMPAIVHRESGVSEILTDTPWVELVDGTVEGLLCGIEKMVLRMLRGEHLLVAPPKLPTEREWAEKLCYLGGWI